MKFLKTPLIFLATSLLLIGFLSAGKVEAPLTAADANGPGFALLELFTSEGCSSCPPADELMGRIQQGSVDRPVYVLSYHVDYWDRNGWKDVFSNAAFTERQYNYSRRFADQVYTPQVIVNGKTEFVGSDATAANLAIDKSLKIPSASSISLSGNKVGDSLQINSQVTGNMNKIRLMIAIVQKHALSNVKAGENKGRALSHWQIVRALHSFPVNAGKEVMVELPEEFDVRNWEVIGFLQDREAGLISAAGRVAIDECTVH